MGAERGAQGTRTEQCPSSRCRAARRQVLNWGLRFEPHRSGAASLIVVAERPPWNCNYSRRHGQRDKAPNPCVSGDIREKLLNLVIRVY